MAHLRALWRLTTLLPSSSLFHHPISFQRHAFASYRSLTFSFDGNPDQVELRKRIKTAMESEEDVRRKEILTELYLYRKQIPQTKGEFVKFVNTTLHLTSGIKQVEEETAQELYEKLEKITPAESINGFTKKQRVFRRRIHALMEQEEDLERKKLLSALCTYPKKIPSTSDKFIRFVTEILPKHSENIDSVDERTAKELYVALGYITPVESLDDDSEELLDYASGDGNVDSKKSERRLVETKEELDDELDWKVKDLVADNKRLKHEVEALRREKFNMTRTNKLPATPTPKLEIPKLMERDDTVDELFSKHGQAVDVVFQIMKSVRKGYHKLDEKVQSLERENRRLQKQIASLTDLQPMINQDFFKTLQKDELDVSNGETNEWEAKFRDIEFEYEKYQNEMEEKLKKAFDITRKLREENIKLASQSVEEKKVDVQQEIPEIMQRFDEILVSLDLESTTRDINDSNESEQDRLDSSKTDMKTQEYLKTESPTNGQQNVNLSSQDDEPPIVERTTDANNRLVDLEAEQKSQETLGSLDLEAAIQEIRDTKQGDQASNDDMKKNGAAQEDTNTKSQERS